MPVQRHVFINHRQTVLCQLAKHALPWCKPATQVKVLRSVADSCNLSFVSSIFVSKITIQNSTEAEVRIVKPMEGLMHGYLTGLLLQPHTPYSKL